MEYRRLGKSGLQVSALSFGAWVTFAQQIGRETAEELISAVFDASVEVRDNMQALEMISKVDQRGDGKNRRVARFEGR